MLHFKALNEKLEKISTNNVIRDSLTIGELIQTDEK